MAKTVAEINGALSTLSLIIPLIVPCPDRVMEVHMITTTEKINRKKFFIVSLDESWSVKHSHFELLNRYYYLSLCTKV